MKTFKILTINPGSTSTKIALFENDQLRFERNIAHNSEDLKKIGAIPEQFSFRKQLVEDVLYKENISLSDIDIVIGRGGLVKPIESGVYRVNSRLKEDLKAGIMGQHASNLGGLIAAAIAEQIPGVEAYIVDPVVVDELSDVARLGGHPLFPRKSIFHALNQKAVARMYAQERGIPYEQLNLIVAHMGGGVSVGAHRKGRVIDVNNALNGSGPFSPERSGTLETGLLVDICFSGEYSKTDVQKMLSGQGGIVAYLGHSNTKKVVDDALNGDKRSELIIQAFCYQVAKEIGAMGTVLSGRVDAILLTGGIAYSDYICQEIIQRVSFIAPVVTYPGEDEMRALAVSGLAVLLEECHPKEYK